MYLEQHTDAELLDYIAWAMYAGSLSKISTESQALVRRFLGALKRTAGPYHHLAILRQGIMLLC